MRGVGMRFFFWAVLSAVLILTTSPTPAQDIDLGPAYEGLITVAGKQIPLPEGVWHVTGHGHTPRRGDDTEPYGAIQTLVMAQVERATVVALAVVNTNTVDVTRGWAYGEPCTRSDFHYTQTYGQALNGSCVWVGHVVTSADIESAGPWLSTLDLARRNGLAVPGVWVAAGFTAATSADFVDIRYYFNPDARGIAAPPAVAWADSAWHPDRIGAHPAKQRFVNQVIGWSDGFRHHVDSGLRAHLTKDRPISLPWTQKPSTIPPDIAARLLKLKALHDQGVLSDADYRTQSEALLEAAEAAMAETTPPWVRALQKTMTWRVLASADTMLLGYIVTGDFISAGSLAGMEVVTKIFAYFGHELAWDYFAGPGTHPPNPIRLDSAGTDHDRGTTPWLGPVGQYLAGWLPQGWFAQPPQREILIVAPPPLLPAAAVPPLKPAETQEPDGASAWWPGSWGGENDAALEVEQPAEPPTPGHTGDESHGWWDWVWP